MTYLKSTINITMLEAITSNFSHLPLHSWTECHVSASFLIPEKEDYTNHGCPIIHSVPFCPEEWGLVPRKFDMLLLPSQGMSTVNLR